MDWQKISAKHISDKRHKNLKTLKTQQLEANKPIKK